MSHAATLAAFAGAGPLAQAEAMSPHRQIELLMGCAPFSIRVEMPNWLRGLTRCTATANRASWWPARSVTKAHCWR